MNRLAMFAALGALLLAAPSFATDADQVETPAVSAAAPEVKQATPKRRRTTLERWRGGPVRYSDSDALVRQEVLDKHLPIMTHTGQIAAAPSF